MENIKNIGFLLSNISIYSDILNDEVFYNLENIITNDDEFEASRAYSKLFKLLCTSEHNGNLYDYIYDKVIYAENLFTLECAKGNFKKLPQHIVDASKIDLTILYKIANLKSSQIKDYLSKKHKNIYENLDFMPNFSNLPKNSSNIGDWGENISHFTEHNTKNGYGLYSRHIFFYLDEKGPTIKPVLNPDDISLDNLKCFEAQRQTIIDNTRLLINGSKTNNVLLYGHRGTGKSSTIKAIVNDFHTDGLRLIEVSKENLKYLGRVIDVLSKIPMKFIVFVDDLTFTDGDDSYTALKAVLEGSSNKLGDNMVLYATTNRRHLVTETFMARQGDEVHLKDTLDETASLSDRFGIMVTFSFPSRMEYLEIIKQLALDNNLAFEEIEAGAISWSAQRGNFSPRTARQYIDFVLAKKMEVNMKKACIFLADGFEEIEAITPLDLLRRKGIDAKFISITGKKEVEGAHKITFLADELFENINFDEFSAFILPGGMPGTKNLNSHLKLKDLIKIKHKQGELICAICAAPSILDEMSLLDNIEATIYPTLELKNSIKTDKNVCVSGNIITSNALGSAIDFSLSIVEYMLSTEEKTSLKSEIVY